MTSEYLYRQHPNEHEGQLTKTKSLLVSKAILSRRALSMGLGKYVLMSQSESESGGRQRLSILADAFESVIGAIYLDQGFEPAREFIMRWLLTDSREIVADKRHTNYKSHLQEYVQSTFRTHPVYRIRSEMGPDHSKQFNVEVLVGRRVLGSGRGRNKKEAEQAAARNALEQVETRPRYDAPPSRPQRSTRGSSTPAPASASAPPSPPVDHETEEGRRRRRGRRGGRGRRRPGDAAEAVESQGAPAPDGNRQEAPQWDSPPERREREEPRPPVEHGRARPSFEDELDEVGRPEGSVEELRVDPYGWGRESEAHPDRPATGETADDRFPGVGGRTVERTPGFRVEPEALETPASDIDEDAPAEPSGDSGGEPQADEPGGAPFYGRRPGRGRR